MRRMDGKLTGAVHFPGRDEVIDIDTVVVEVLYLATDPDIQIFCIMRCQSVDPALAGREILPEGLTVVSKAADDADP